MEGGKRRSWLLLVGLSHFMVVTAFQGFFLFFVMLLKVFLLEVFAICFAVRGIRRVEVSLSRAGLIMGKLGHTLEHDSFKCALLSGRK